MNWSLGFTPDRTEIPRQLKLTELAAWLETLLAYYSLSAKVRSCFPIAINGKHERTFV